jgi:uncharacterized membrane protein
VLNLRNVLLTLHVFAAILTIGWLAMHSMVVPRAIRGGPANAGYVRFAGNAAKKIGPASGIVFLLGIWLVARSDAYSFKDAWISVSMLLYIVTAVVGAVFIGRAEQRAADALENGGAADGEAKTIGMLGGISSLLLVVIVFLMVAKPGG